LSCGSRNQKIDPALAQPVNLLFTGIGKLYVKLNAGMFAGKSPDDQRHQTVKNDISASEPRLAAVWIRQIFQRPQALLHLVEDVDAAAEQHLAMGREFGAL